MTTHAQDHAALRAAERQQVSNALEDAAECIDRLGDALARISMFGNALDADIADASLYYRALRRAIKGIQHEGRWVE